MRLNLYHHEIPIMAERIEHVVRESDTGEMFHGIMFHTEPPRMDMPGDDDSSAITFWVPWTKRDGSSTDELRTIFSTALAICDIIDQQDRERTAGIDQS